jgi:3',5'-cyclic-AMP phosphodiesterase
MTRRGLLGLMGGFAGSSLLGPLSGSLLGAQRRTLRCAFVTDLHLPAKGQEKRAEAMHKALASHKPDLVIYGGDNVMAVDYGKGRDDADGQFAAFQSLHKQSVRSPSLAVIGNHDIWWNKEDPSLEKGLALSAFGMPSRYYKDQAGGWTMLLLDTFHKDGCHIDAEQLEWLKAELARDKKPLLLVSHAPILTASHFHELGNAKDGGWKVPSSWQIANTVVVQDLLKDSRRPVLSLSGHMHHVDYVEYHQVRYFCGGAASGAWWGGSYHHFPPAFTILTLHPDGKADRETVFWEQPKGAMGGLD